MHMMNSISYIKERVREMQEAGAEDLPISTQDRAIQQILLRLEHLEDLAKAAGQKVLE